jgi:4-amino-4-deoxy-L-arabinose transferase-like glycosyltransferase
MPLCRAQALGIVLALWAAIYLPALGSLEIRGEEGHRILPGVTMLATGRWIVPSVGGVDYLAKPPLLNWLIAGAIRAAGSQSEWVVRAPSAAAVLALGLGTVWMLDGWLGVEGALLAAIFMLTGIGLMEKGRQAELESLYICLYGLALVSWLGLWQRAATAREIWAAWTVPWLFLGLGLLAKGPLNLLFFYAVAGGVLIAAGRARELARWPHLAGVALMLAIFAAWAVPFLREISAARAGAAWTAQLAGRVEVDDAFRLGPWLLNIPRSLINFLPWAVLLPLLWRRTSGAADGLDLAILRGGRWGMAASFLAVNLAPGGVARYSMPLLAPASIWLALACIRTPLPAWLPLAWARTLTVCLAASAIGALAIPWEGLLLLPVVFLAWQWMQRDPNLCRLAIASGLLMAILTAEFALGAVPRLRKREHLRPLAARIAEITGPDQPVYGYQPGFLPLFFYLRPPGRYTQKIADFPPDAHFLLVAARDEPEALKELEARNRVAQPVLTVQHLVNSTWQLWRVSPPETPRL